jgi:organic hydroperoxide reductase OsmC/OhrA
MQIAAVVVDTPTSHDVSIRTGTDDRPLAVPARSAGRGSSVNGGEFLMLALATCYCNDVFREAARMAIPVDRVEVEACADFPGIGLAATNIRYRATIGSEAPDDRIAQLLARTDAVAEVHNTMRAGVPVERLRT